MEMPTSTEPLLRSAEGGVSDSPESSLESNDSPQRLLKNRNRMLNECDSGAPSVSIIFLTYNGMPLVERVLQAVKQQEFLGKVEILCIDSMSTDGTFELCQKYCDRCIRIQPEDFHHARTRNLGVSLASNDICLFLSQDALPLTVDWLSRLVEPFLEASTGAVYGRQEAPASFGAQRRYSLSETYPAIRQVRRFNQGKKRSLQDVRFSNANGAVRRNLLLQFPFPENILHSEDVGVCYQLLEAGNTVIYEPAATVVHGHERNLKEEFGWAFDSGASLKRLGILGNSNFTSETYYGLKKMSGELIYFLRKGAIGTSVLSTCVFMARWLGVQCGKREKKLPTFLLRMLSPTINREYRRAQPAMPDILSLTESRT